MENEKYLFVVSGAAGTGKDSVVKALREAHPEIEKTVSATTRAPRATRGSARGSAPPRVASPTGGCAAEEVLRARPARRSTRRAAALCASARSSITA